MKQLLLKDAKTDNSQCARLLRRFKDGESITSMSAYMLMGITQLGARIKELEDKGYVFNRPWIDLPSGKRVKQYSLMPCSKCGSLDQYHAWDGFAFCQICFEDLKSNAENLTEIEQ
jgi:hypothetical protein